MKIRKFTAFTLAFACVFGVLQTEFSIDEKVSAVLIDPDGDDETEQESYVKGSYGNLYYRRYSDHVEISSCTNAESGDVTIPSVIDNLPVTVITDNAFMNCENIVSITFPESVVSIGQQALSGCTSLQTVTIENPECVIYDSADTICNSVSISEVVFTGVIYSTGSAVQEYAQKYGYVSAYVYVVEIPTTSTETTTSTTTTTTDSTTDTTTTTTATYTSIITDSTTDTSTTTTDIYTSIATDSATYTITTTTDVYTSIATDLATYTITTITDIYTSTVTTVISTDIAPTSTGISIAEPFLFGDVNSDNKVTLADAVTILQYVSNPEKYPLSEYSLDSADVYNRGDGVTGMDALAIQKYDSGIIEYLPESHQ